MKKFIALISIVSILCFQNYAFADVNQSANLVAGSQQYFSTPASGNFLNITGSLTVTAWVKFNSLPTNEQATIASHYNNGQLANSQWQFGLVDNGGGQFSLLGGFSFGTNPLDHAEVTTPWIPSIGTWYQVALALDTTASGTVKFYVDGVQRGTTQVTNITSLNPSVNDFVIGALTYFYNPPQQNFFDGDISQVALFNIALTPDQISGYYCHQQLTGTESGLVGLWNLDGNGEDSTTNGNTLVGHNGASFTSDAPNCIQAPTISSFVANPTSITSGQSAQLSWSVSGASSLTIDQGVGTVTGTSVSVSPTQTTTYTLTASNNGLSTSTATVTVTVTAPPPSPTAVRKSTSQTLVSSTVLQNDTDLSLQLQAGKTYLVDGVIFASTTNATPDIKIAFTKPSGSDMDIGFIANSGSSSSGGLLQTSGGASVRIPLPANIPTPIIIHGTIVTTTAGTLQLQWAQFASNVKAIQVAKGSYLKVSEI